MSDIFVLASIREGMSNALLEAMYFRKYCIVSNIPENKALIDNSCGLTFSNSKSLTNLLNNCNKKTIKNLGNKAKSKVLKEHSMKKIQKQYLGAIKCVG
jgi:glycosyltransferase involved in cell wall biosynthesis